MIEQWTAISKLRKSGLTDAFIFARSMSTSLSSITFVMTQALQMFPLLAFYTQGHVDHLLVGISDSDTIVNAIEAWLDST